MFLPFFLSGRRIFLWCGRRKQCICNYSFSVNTFFLRKIYCCFHSILDSVFFIFRQLRWCRLRRIFFKWILIVRICFFLFVFRFRFWLEFKSTHCRLGKADKFHINIQFLPVLYGSHIPLIVGIHYKTSFRMFLHQIRQNSHQLQIKCIIPRHTFDKFNILFIVIRSQKSFQSSRMIDSIENNNFIFFS